MGKHYARSFFVKRCNLTLALAVDLTLVKANDDGLAKGVTNLTRNGQSFQTVNTLHLVESKAIVAEEIVFIEVFVRLAEVSAVFVCACMGSDLL